MTRATALKALITSALTLPIAACASVPPPTLSGVNNYVTNALSSPKPAPVKMSDEPVIAREICMNPDCTAIIVSHATETAIHDAMAAHNVSRTEAQRLLANDEMARSGENRLYQPLNPEPLTR